MKEFFEFLKTQRIAVMAVTMPGGGSHAAALHFAHIEDPLTLIFITDPESRKGEALKAGPVSASVVVGTDEGVMKTAQLNGTAELKDTPELRAAYYAKYPDATKWQDDVFVAFTPSWWRFTDYNRPEGKTVWTSDGVVKVDE